MSGFETVTGRDTQLQNAAELVQLSFLFLAPRLAQHGTYDPKLEQRSGPWPSPAEPAES